jgi:hypothetical protein
MNIRTTHFLVNYDKRTITPWPRYSTPPPFANYEWAIFTDCKCVNRSPKAKHQLNDRVGLFISLDSAPWSVGFCHSPPMGDTTKFANFHKIQKWAYFDKNGTFMSGTILLGELQGHKIHQTPKDEEIYHPVSEMCECGSKFIKGAGHSSWCPASKQ